MTDRVDLRGQGIRLYAAWLHNHDYLWFSSLEISKTTATVPLIHNYALSYAISGYSHGIYAAKAPQYDDDLAAMPAYATPAGPNGYLASTRFTQNAINSVTLRTDDAPRGINSPGLGWRIVLDPVWRTDPARNASGFSFYLFTRAAFHPPCVMRLGKKGCPVRLECEEIIAPVAILSESAIRPTHAVNPIDVQGDIRSYEPVSIPPHLILRVADIEKDWFIFAGKHRIHVPRRFTPVGASIPSDSVRDEPRKRLGKRTGRKLI